MNVKEEPGRVTEDMTEPEPVCLYRNVKSFNNESFSWVKAECCLEGENSALANASKLPAQCVKLIKTEVADVANAMDDPSGLEVCWGNTELLQKKETSTMPGWLQDHSYTYVTSTLHVSQDKSSQHDEKVHDNRIQTVVKSEPNMQNGEEIYRKICLSRDVKDSYACSLSSDVIFTNQPEQVKAYKCGTCPYFSNHLFDLYKHNISHKVENIFVCDLCQSTFHYFLDLKYHLMSHAVNTEILSHLPFSAEQCSSEIWKFDEVKHVNEDLLTCCVSKTKCQDVEEMKSHGIILSNVKLESDDENSHSCSPEQDLVLHKESCVDSRQYSFDILLQKCIDNDPILNHNSAYQNISAVKTEREQKKLTESNTRSGNSFTNSCCANQNWKQRDGPENKRQFSCDLCSFTCGKKAYLTRHKRRHSGEKPYSCDECDYKSDSLALIKLHKRTHTGEKPFSCEFCKFTCRSKSHLKRHTMARHTNERPHSCDLCEYKSVTLYHLRIHKRKHTGEKPYSCDICEDSFSHVSSLKEHKKCHSSEKPYICDLCDDKYARLSLLKAHKKKHTGEKPFSCDLCEYKCSKPSRLREHKRSHTGEKLYSCEFCDYKCTRLSHLQQHEWKHASTEPYSCDLCDYTCGLFSSLTQHKKGHTNKMPCSSGTQKSEKFSDANGSMLTYNICRGNEDLEMKSYEISHIIYKPI